MKTNSTGGSPFADAPASGGLWPLTPRTELIILVACGLAQVAILAAMIVLDGLPLLLGERVRLDVVPLDPRDLFRGDYVVLGYDFTNSGMVPIENLRIRSSDPYGWDQGGEDVYISLRREGDAYKTVSISGSRPASGTYLQGKHTGYNQIECGIEAYYVQEGEGRRLEQAIRSRKVQAEVAIWNGKGKLVRIVD